MPETPLFLFDDASAGSAGFLKFSPGGEAIEAWQPAEVPAALRRIEEVLAAGRHVAGWMAYELGYALEPRLSSLDWRERKLPILSFGVFGQPQKIARKDVYARGRAYAGPLRHGWDEAAYTRRFDQVHDYIEAGDIYQANLSFRSRFAFAGDPLALHLHLRDRAAATHGAYIDDGARQILSLSPELFFSISAEGIITARPMKGTAPRGIDELSDDRLKAALAASPKDRAENLMIVDLLRNDVGRLALIGSVSVPDLFVVETYPTLHTMVSTVTAQMKPATRVESIVRALFPCGSITGAPKIRAMEIIRELEETSRGAYCGAMGYFAPDGSANFNVAIRTITIADGRGELGVGGAVVQDSKADAEYAECLLKARFFEDVRRPLGLIETLRYENGFLRLGRHLDRLRNSAAILGLPFDRDAALNILKRSVVHASEALRVRLTLDEAGAFACTISRLDPAAVRWSYSISPHRVDSNDSLLRHKTTWREFYDDELHRMQNATGCDEVVFLNERGELAEGSRTTIFVRRDGKLLTPPLTAGVLDGVLRRELIEEAGCCEASLTPADLDGDVYLGNSLRGLIRATMEPKPVMSCAGTERASAGGERAKLRK